MRVARLVSAVAAGALGLTSLLALAPAASAAATGSVTGSIYSTNVIGLSDVTVSLEEPVTGAATPYSAQTDQWGSWSIAGVAVGDYVVHYTGRVSGYSPDLTDLAAANVVTVNDGLESYVYEPLSSYTVPPDYQVVVKGSDGAPLSICPRFYPSANPDDGPYGDFCTTTDGVTSGIIGPGTYFVEFRDDAGAYAPTWIGADGTRATATKVTVPATGIGDLGTVTMPVAAHISITIAAEDTRAAIAGWTCVAAFVGRTDEFAGNGCTDGAGVITVDGLRPGSFTLQTQTKNLDYVDRWVGGARTQSSARLVTVAEGRTVNAGRLPLPRGGVVTGTVRDRRGKPIEGICASTGRFGPVGGEDGTRQLTDSCTDAQGRYRIRGLDSGSVRIQFVTLPWASTTPAYAFAWYGGTNHANADDVKVKLGKTTKDIDATLVPEGTLTGTATTSTGDPISGFIWADDFVTGYPISYGEDYPGTSFTLGHLPTTTVLLHWTGSDNKEHYWDGSRYGTLDRTKAVAIRTKAGTALTGITIHVTP